MTDKLPIPVPDPEEAAQIADARQAAAQDVLKAELVEEPETASALPQNKATKDKPEKRHILRRLFGISLWGAIKLLALNIAVGFFVLASNFDPTSPDVNVSAALSSLIQQTADALTWGVTHFWKPALAGAALVMPVWVLWRLVSLPFRK